MDADGDGVVTLDALSKKDAALKKSPRVQVRLVWRLVLCLFGHITLLLILAIYLEISLNSVRRYTPVANAEEIQLESLNTLPAMLGAMDAERRNFQKTNDPLDVTRYGETRRAVEEDLASLNTPLLLSSADEMARRDLGQRWIKEVGDPTMAHPGLKPADQDRFNATSATLLDRLTTVSESVRAEVRASLSTLQEGEAAEAHELVNLMWIGVASVSFVTIMVQAALANSIIRPLQILAGAVRRLQSGDYTARARIGSGDEIQSLGDTFNSMAENIQRAQQELEEKNQRLSVQQEALRDANVGLEARVAEKTRELEDKNQKLHEAARLKDEFLATLSHELRTPLTPVISCAHLLGTDPRLGHDQLKNVQVIDRNARVLSRMIDELLDLSSVMNRKLRLLRERTEMNEWTKATLETMRPAWNKKKLTVTFVPAPEPVELEIDPARLAQVLTNLINNAIKYTGPRGQITVQVVVSEEDVRIAVTDTGAGLNQQEIEQIFEMFHQSRPQGTESVGGLGVGLTIARSLAELHGGGLLAESPGPGQGATFNLRLPRQTPTEVTLPAPRLSVTVPVLDRTPLQGRRLWLVEDSTDTREALQRIYQRRECLVTAAASGEDALEIAQREAPPDIIISDIGLPGISGLELMIKLRARPEFRDVIAIALSGLGRDSDIKAASEAGFDAHLLKPVDLNVLDKLLMEALRTKASLSVGTGDYSV